MRDNERVILSNFYIYVNINQFNLYKTKQELLISVGNELLDINTIISSDLIGLPFYHLVDEINTTPRFNQTPSEILT